VCGLKLAEKRGNGAAGSIIGLTVAGHESRWWVCGPCSTFPRLLSRFGLTVSDMRSVGTERGVRGSGPHAGMSSEYDELLKSQWRGNLHRASLRNIRRANGGSSNDRRATARSQICGHNHVRRGGMGVAGLFEVL